MAVQIGAGVMRGLALRQIRHLTPVPPGTAEPLAERVYRQVERSFGVLAPPVALHAPAPEAMAACWMMLRETLVAPGLVGRAVKEAVAAAVSRTNTCPYCVSVHAATLRGIAGRTPAALIAADRIGEIADPVLRDAAAWAREASLSASPDPIPAPFERDRGPEYLGVALTFHYINRMVNVFLEDAPMPPGAPRRGLPVVERILSAMIRSAGRRCGAPGESLELLPEAELPADLDWARGNPDVAQALARAAAAVERAGERSVPDRVRELVRARLAVWDGRPHGARPSWAGDAVASLPAADRSAGRLALLVAMASYQVDASTVQRVRAETGRESAVVEIASWAALAAARRTAARAVPAALRGDHHPADRFEG